MDKFQKLLTPLTIGRTEVRNRVLVSAHVPGLAEDNKPGERYIRYHETFAAAGVGLQITGGTPIHRSGMLSLSGDGLWNLNDAIVPGYQRLADAVHHHGGRILAQLAHSAGTVPIVQPGIANWAPSTITAPTSGSVSHEMSGDQIAEITQAYVDAAERVVVGRLDGVEILSAFGFLPHAFLSPRTNFRGDDYGGSLENRQRFLVELLQAVRAAIGPDAVLGVRIPGDEYETGGLDLGDMQRLARRLSDDDLVDYINVTAHSNMSHTGRALHWPPTPAEHGSFVKLAAGIRAHVNVPVFTVGRITDPHHAEKILQSDQADMVGMTRAHICDPDIVAKLKRGAADQIRPCVGTNNCIANRLIGKPIRCVHNPAIADMPIATAPSRKILIVGGGPAGLEAARCGAARGHQINIIDQQPKAGGQLALWARSPGQTELDGIIKWRLTELARLGVKIQLGQHVGAEEIRKSDAEAIILATGANAFLTRIAGDNSILVFSPQQILNDEIERPGKIIVWSDGRGQAGLAAAEWLAAHGSEVEIITSDIAVAADIDATNRHSWYQRLSRLGCRHQANSIIEKVLDGVVYLQDIYSQERSQRTDLTAIVDWRGSRPNTELSADDNRVLEIGDRLNPRNVEIAIAEGAGAIIQIERRFKNHG
jgi:2,4-dienoyl-CoA reductase-like NADH-dependent reductase (Old Yellow Enzyme family)/thioredoxin reductase